MLIRIVNPGQAVSIADVHSFEANNGLRLPESYRNFLLKWNGGKPVPSLAPVEGMPLNPWIRIHYFYRLHGKANYEDLDWNYGNRPDALPDGCISIGCSGSGDSIILSTRDPVPGSVWLWDWYHKYVKHSYLGLNLFKMADSFDELLERLQDAPDITQPVEEGLE